MTGARYIRLAKEGAWIVFGQTASVLGSLILVRVLTEHLDSTQYGHLALGLTVAGLVNQVVMGGVSAGIGRFYSIAAAKHDLHGYLAASRQLMAYATLAVLTIAFLLIVSLFLLGHSEWVGLAAAALAFSILSGYNSSINGIQNAARQRATVAVHGGLDAWLKILLSLLVLVWLGSSSTAVVIGYTLSSLFVVTSQLLFLRRLIPAEAEQSQSVVEWKRQMWVYSWPMAVGGLFNWGYYASQRWALELFATTGDVGEFFALTQIAYTPISMAGGMFLSFLTPILFSRVADVRDHARLRDTHHVIIKLAIAGLTMTAVLAIATYFLHEPVFRLMVAAEYRNISKYMPYVIIAAGILQVSQTIGSIVLLDNNTSAILPLAIYGQLYISAQNFICVYFIGVPGLIISMIVGSIIHLTWMIIIVTKLAITK